jgi:hypothetical protein
MPQGNLSTPDIELPVATPADVVAAVNRCLNAYHEALDKPTQKNDFFGREHHHQATLAYLGQLPILTGPQSFQLYISCVSHGASVGAIDPVDVGRFCHIANTAMAAWKLANLTVPAARQKEKDAAEKREKSRARDHESRSTDRGSQATDAGTPPPSKGNHQQLEGNQSIEEAILELLENLPTVEVQRQLFQVLRDRNIPMPGNGELRDNPIAALHCVRMAQELLRKEALEKAFANDPKRPQPAPQPNSDKPAPSAESPAQPQQAA